MVNTHTSLVSEHAGFMPSMVAPYHPCEVPISCHADPGRLVDHDRAGHEVSGSRILCVPGHFEHPVQRRPIRSRTREHRASKVSSADQPDQEPELLWSRGLCDDKLHFHGAVVLAATFDLARSRVAMEDSVGVGLPRATSDPT